MKRFNRLLTFVLLACMQFYIANGVKAQTNADMQLAEILNSVNVYELKERYPELRDSISVDMLDVLAQTQLALSFNRLDEGVVWLDSLLNNYQEDMGVETSLTMASYHAMNMLNLGRYKECGLIASNLYDALKGSYPDDALFSYIFMKRVGEALSDVPVPYIERPARDVKVPMSVVEVGRGKHLLIPVEVNGITKNFIFDTGCSYGCFVPESYAKEIGLRIVEDSVPVMGITVGMVKLATADSMRVGDIVYHNPVFMVAPQDTVMDSVFKMDGVLGYNFISAANEIVLDFENKEFVFPSVLSEGEPNMAFLSSNTPILRIEYKGNPIDVVFDSGNVKTDLSSDFTERFPEAVAGLELEEERIGGFGGIEVRQSYMMPDFSFRISSTDVTMHDVPAAYSTKNGGYMGCFGADFLTMFKRVTISYKYMFMKCEK